MSSLDITPLRSIEEQLQHAMWLRQVLVADLRIGYRWLWANRAMALVCVVCGSWSAAAVFNTEPFEWLWWVNLVAAVLNFGLTPYNLWRGERSWNRQLRDTAMLPTAIESFKRARALALQCPKLGPGDECAYCTQRGCACPFAEATK